MTKTKIQPIPDKIKMNKTKSFKMALGDTLTPYKHEVLRMCIPDIPDKKVNSLKF